MNHLRPHWFHQGPRRGRRVRPVVIQPSIAPTYAMQTMVQPETPHSGPFSVEAQAIQNGRFVEAGGKRVRVRIGYGALELIGPYGFQRFPSRRMAASYVARLMARWERQYGSFTTNIPYHRVQASALGHFGDLGAKDTYGKYKEFLVEGLVVRDYGKGELRIVTGGVPGSAVPRSTTQWYRLTNAIKAIKQGKVAKTLTDITSVAKGVSAGVQSATKKKRRRRRRRVVEDDGEVPYEAPPASLPPWVLPVGVAGALGLVLLVVVSSRRAA